jgi:hypothetical protein
MLVAAVVAVCFLVSLLAEWPVFHAGLKRRGAGRCWTAGASLRATLAAQVVSYLLLVPFYLAVALQTPRGWKLTRATEFASAPSAAVLFLSLDGLEVRSIQLDGSDEKSVGATGGVPRWAFLRLEGSPDGQELALTVMDSVGTDKGFAEYIPRTLLRFSGTPATTRPYWEHDPVHVGTLRDAVDFRAAARVPWQPWNRDPNGWEVRASGLPSRGLRAMRRATGEDVRVAVDVPGASWSASSATVLPGDQVVFQLGDYVMLADLNTRKLAPLCRGRSPVVLSEGASVMAAATRVAPAIPPTSQPSR